MTIQEIRLEYEQLTSENIRSFIEKYSEDTRSGVQKLIKQCQNRIQKEMEEEIRLEHMLMFERKYYKTCNFVCGIDEAGRGPLAGPVVAAAVILPKNHKIAYLNDSKQLSEKKREEL